MAARPQSQKEQEKPTTGVVSIDNSTNNVGQVVHVTNNFYITTNQSADDVAEAIKKSSSDEQQKQTPKGAKAD